MLDPTTILPPEWLSLALAVIAGASGGGGIVGALALYANRKKRRADANEADSRTELNLANARSIDTSSSVTAGEAILEFIVEARQLEARLIKQSEELLEQDNIIRDCNTEISRLKTENDLYETQKRHERGKRLLGTGHDN